MTEKIIKTEIKLVGIKARTKNVAEMDPSQANAKIGPLVEKYWNEGVSNKVTNRKAPGVTFCAYTEYESDHNGDYTFFIGEEVESFKSTPEGYSEITVPAGEFAKFTSETGGMPKVCIELWQKIWKMGDAEFGGKRKYTVDYEVYDQRAQDPKNTELDIYIAI